jgi:YD repeat-containing protein
LVTDSSGNVFFIDNGGPNNRYIREILASTGNIQTVPGLSSVPDADGLAIDSSGNLYISTAYNNSYYWYLDTNTVQKWTASTGVLTTIAGTTTPGYSGDGGLATSAELNQPSGLVVDSSGDVFVADTYNCVVREISASTGDISTIAGNGTCGTTTYGGLATSTELNRPGGVALDGSGNLYISDSGTHLISEVSASSGDISAVASGSVFSGRLAIDSSGNLYSTNYTNSVLEIDPSTGSVTTLAGSYSYPGGVAVDSSGSVYVADFGNNRIDEISSAPLPINFSPATLNFGTQSILTASSQTTTVTNTSLSTLTISSDALTGGEHADFTRTSDSCYGASLASGATCAITVKFIPSAGGTRWADLTFSDGITSGPNYVYLVGIGAGYVSTIAGTGTYGYTGDGGPAVSAEVSSPLTLVTDSSGNVFFIDNDTSNYRYIREIVASTGDIETVSGLSSVPDANGLAIDSSGNLYISTSYSGYYTYLHTNTVEKWTASTGTLSTLAGSATAGYTGDGGAATSAELNNPSGLAVDSSGNIFIADTGNCVVRKISVSTGDISTVAGDGSCGSTSYGGLAISTAMGSPGGVVLDPSGNLYISAASNTISEVSASTGDISLVASGSVFSGRLAMDSSGDLFSTNYSNAVLEIDPSTGSVTTLAGSYWYPQGVAVDSLGNLYVADSNNNRIAEISRYGTAPTGGLVSTPQRSGGGGGISPGTCTCKSGDPIDTASGDFTESATDTALPTYGPSLSFARTYDAASGQAESASSTPGPLGYGWTDNWDTSLALNSDYGTTVSGDVTLTQANGSEALFVPPVSGSCQAPYTGPGSSGTYCKLPRVLGSLTYNSGSSTYTLVEHPNTTYTFNSSGQLSSIADPAGATESLTYSSPSPGSGHCPSGAGSCETITSASGRTLTLGWSGSGDSGTITSVTDAAARRTTYSYSSGNLTSVTDPLGNVTSYSYDSSNAPTPTSSTTC